MATISSASLDVLGFSIYVLGFLLRGMFLGDLKDRKVNRKGHDVAESNIKYPKIILMKIPR